MAMADTQAHFLGYRVARRTVTVANQTFELLGPADYEELLADQRVAAGFEADEYLPYWAEFWPASVLLAEEVAAWGPAPGDGPPPSVLDLGCGLGLISLVAARLGYCVTACDWDEHALCFVRENARLNQIPAPATARVDWRRSYPELRANRIVAAEVLYEERSLEPVARFIRDHLEPGGFGLVCDAYRPTADRFQTVARSLGLAVEQRHAERVGPTGAVVRGRLFELRRRPCR